VEVKDAKGEWLEVRDTEAFKTLVGDPDSAKRFFDQDWIKSLIKEVGDFDKLADIGPGVMEVQGLKVEVSGGVERNKYYYQARVLDRGVTVKVYDDNATILSYMGLDARYEVLKVAMTTILMEGYLKKNEFFKKLKPGREVQYFGAVGTVKERGDNYAIIEFRADTDRGEVVSVVKINAARLMVNGRTVVNVKEGEDGSIYLLYKVRGEIRGVPIKAPKKKPEKNVERTLESRSSENLGP
jgi:hypothetical protein